MRVLLTIGLIIMGGSAAWIAAYAQPLQEDEFVQQRREAAHRQRRIILNDDGNVVIYYPQNLPVTAENVLAQRTAPLVGSHVDSIFYCPISAGFGYFTHNTKVGAVLEHPIFGSRNIARELINQGTDSLKMIVDFAHAHGLEVFFSMRMNDTHDAAHRPDNPYPLFPPLKQQHPEWLLGSWDKRPPYAPWSSVDYGRPEIRELAFRFIEEVCQNYEVDGVELDFFRHLAFFKSVAYGGQASPEERDLMTELMRRIRQMAEAEGRKRGRPILLAVRVPDSVEYCRAVGLDLERWLAEGLIDLLIGSGYFQLNPWEYLVQLGHKYGVPVYPSLDESRVRSDGPPYPRNSIESYRARAAQAWQSGADGVYLFNFFNPRSPMLWEIGDPHVLARLDKYYFVTVRHYSPEMYLKGGRAFQNLPVLTPDNPLPLVAQEPATLPLWLGEQTEAIEEAQPRFTLALMCPAPSPLQVSFNGTALTAPTLQGVWQHYEVPPRAIKPGKNEVRLTLPPPGASEQEAWEVVWQGPNKPVAPWTSDRPASANVRAESQQEALRIADQGTQSGDYLYFYYAWNASPQRKAVAEVEAKVISGRNNIIVSNGVASDRVALFPDYVELYSTGERVAMNTTEAFHTYRIELVGQDMKVFADGRLLLDAAGKFVAPAPEGRNAFQFGAATSTETGEALWRAVRLRTGSISLFDVVLVCDYP